MLDRKTGMMPPAVALLLAVAVLFPATTTAQEFAWAGMFGPVSSAEGAAPAGNGGLVVTGFFSNSSVDFDPGPGVVTLPKIGSGDDAFVVRLDGAGELVWATHLRNTVAHAGGIAHGRSVGVDSEDNVVSAGVFGGTFDFDPGPGVFPLGSTGQSGGYISKLDGNGDFVWAKALEGDGSRVQTLAVDSEDNVLVTGSFQGQVDLDPGPGALMLTSAGGNDIFILKLDPNGDLLWAKTIGGASGDRGDDLSVDAADNIYSSGSFVNTVDFDPGPGVFNLTAPTGTRYVLKLDAAGDFEWAIAYQIGSSGANTRAPVLSSDAAGNVHLAGRFQGTVDFDPGPGTFMLTSSSLADMFVSKLDTDANMLWVRQYEGAANAYPVNAIRTDSAGGVYTTGHLAGTVDLDPGPGVFNLSGPSAFVAKLDSEGDFGWAIELQNDQGHGENQALAVDSEDNIFALGSFDNGPYDFDPGPGVFEMSAPALAAYFLKLSPPACAGGPGVVSGFDAPLTDLVAEDTPAVPLPAKAFQAGRTLPLKFELLCDGTPTTGGSAPEIISVVRTEDAYPLPLEDLDSGLANDDGVLFRLTGSKWAFNLSTGGFQTGTYVITVRVPDGRLFNGAFVLR